MVKWHGEQAKKKIHRNAHGRLLEMGHWVEDRAKENISKAVYATAPSPNYLRTGLAMSSIHTVERGRDVLVGASVESFKKDAAAMGVDVGGITFYLPFIEKGHIVHSAAGDWFYPARPFLVPALDALRQKKGHI